MTVKEAILSYPGLSDISDNAVEKVLTDRSADGAASYTSTLKATVELCAADLYVLQLTAPDFSESRLSVTMTRAEISKAAERLYRANGETDNADSMKIGMGKSKENWW